LRQVVKLEHSFSSRELQRTRKECDGLFTRTRMLEYVLAERTLERFIARLKLVRGASRACSLEKVRGLT
jgi:hypothetical protein